MSVEWRRLHNEELHALYSSPNVNQVFKSRTIRWAIHVTLWEKEDLYKWFWCGDQRARDHLEDIGVDGRVNMQELSDKDIDLIHLA